MSTTNHSRNRLTYLLSMLVGCVACFAAAASLKPIVPAEGYEHDKWVTQPADIKKEFRAYITSFDSNDDDNGDGDPDLWRIPQWVAYEIQSHEGELETFPRPSWFTDDTLHEEQVAPDDESYRGSGFDKGHLCMKHIASRLGADADHNTHTMLSAVPQKGNFNQGIWLDLEDKTKEWADQFGSIWVICGPVFYGKEPRNWIGDEDELRVAVPDGFFKVVVRESDNPDRPKVLAFFYPHHYPYAWKGPYDHSQFLVPVNYLESLTGLDFLSALPSSTEGSVEGQTFKKLWE